MRTDERTGRHDEANSRFSQFCEPALKVTSTLSWNDGSTNTLYNLNRHPRNAWCNTNCLLPFYVLFFFTCRNASLLSWGHHSRQNEVASEAKELGQWQKGDPNKLLRESHVHRNIIISRYLLCQVTLTFSVCFTTVMRLQFRMRCFITAITEPTFRYTCTCWTSSAVRRITQFVLDFHFAPWSQSTEKRSSLTLQLELREFSYTQFNEH